MTESFDERCCIEGRRGGRVEESRRRCGVVQGRVDWVCETKVGIECIGRGKDGRHRGVARAFESESLGIVERIKGRIQSDERERENNGTAKGRKVTQSQS